MIRRLWRDFITGSAILMLVVGAYVVGASLIYGEWTKAPVGIPALFISSWYLHNWWSEDEA